MASQKVRKAGSQEGGKGGRSEGPRARDMDVVKTKAASNKNPEFDAIRALQPLIDKCVHCGFCLSTCPSYLLLGQETDSPRGRIYLMKAGIEGRVTVTDSFVEHFDTCLGCMACETACPSGVKYAPLVEATRATIERRYTRPLHDRLFRAVLFRLLP